jgi:hypothetical protein
MYADGARASQHVSVSWCESDGSGAVNAAGSGRQGLACVWLAYNCRCRACVWLQAVRELAPVQVFLNALISSSPTLSASKIKKTLYFVILRLHRQRFREKKKNLS